MLVVTRKAGESLMIGEDVEVKVIAVGRDFVRLGVSAPRSVPVHRQEVFVSLKKEQDGTAEEAVEK